MYICVYMLNFLSFVLVYRLTLCLQYLCVSYLYFICTCALSIFSAVIESRLWMMTQSDIRLILCSEVACRIEMIYLYDYGNFYTIIVEMFM